jgi:hypothetical protein
MERTMTVNEYLKQDRQWTRECRIDHARLKLRQCNALDVHGRKFWLLVLEANGAN